MKNTSASTINSVNISYDAVINRNPSTTPNPYPCSYRVSSAAVLTSSSSANGTFNDAAGTWTSSTDLSFSTPASGTGIGAPGTQAAISPLFRIGGATKTTILTGLSWGSNQYLYIRWKDADDSGADATAGVDNFSISLTVPTVTAPTVTSIGTTSATLGANVTADGGVTLTSRGTVWGTVAAPTGNPSAEGGITTGIFTQSRTGLTANTAYFYRGYAVNGNGTGYSPDGTFITLPLPPTVGSGSSATTSGFTANWSPPIMGSVAYTYTVEVDNDSNFGSIDVTADNIPSGATSRDITGLAENTTYYYRVKSVNAQGSSVNSSTSAAIATSAASGNLATSPGSLSALKATPYGTPSESANFTVTGSGLDSSGVRVTPPAGFEVSTTSSFDAVGTSASPLSLGTSATLSTTVYVRLAATTVPGSYSGNISVAGGAASTQTVAIALSTVDTKALTIAGAAVTPKTYDGTTAATITGTLTGVIQEDNVSLNGTGTFDNANAGSEKTVASTSGLGGTHASRYTLTQPTGLKGTINKANQAITFQELNPAVVGGPAITLSATANSSRNVSFSSSDTSVASVVGSTVTIVGLGSATITASLADNENYNAAPNVTRTLKVLPNAPTTLAAGDLAVIGYDTAGVTNDYFFILVLKDLGPGTSFYVNDNEISADGGTGFTDLAEGEATFTVKAGQGVAAGTILNLPWGAAAVSTTQYDWSSTSGFGLSNNNEEIYIYTAAAITSTTPTTFIFGTKIGTSPSARPNGLTAGTTFISPNGTASRYKLTSARYSGSPDQLLAAIGDTVNNWEATAPGATTDWAFSFTPEATISTSGTLGAFSTTYGTPSEPQAITVVGSNLTANVTATAPTGFEVSSDNGATYGSTATFTQTGGAASGSLKVRLAAMANVTGAYNSQTIRVESTGATTRSVTTASSGNLVAPKALSVTDPTIAPKLYNGTPIAGQVTVGTLSGFVPSKTVTATATAANYSSANAGTYNGVVVTYTLVNGEGGGLASNYSLAPGSATGTINRATPSITFPTTASAITYGKTLATSNFTGGTATGIGSTQLSGNFAWSTPNIIPPLGTTSYDVVFILSGDDANNYNWDAASSAMVSVTVNAEPVGTTYNDWLQAQGLNPSDANAALLEYVYGAKTLGALDPSLKPTIAIVPPAGGAAGDTATLVLTYYVRQNAVGLRVTPKTSADLAAAPGDWTTVTDDEAVGSPTTRSDGVTVQMRKASVPMIGDRKFLKLEAVQQ